jgi:hypothetical protein
MPKSLVNGIHSSETSPIPKRRAVWTRRHLRPWRAASVRFGAQYGRFRRRKQSLSEIVVHHATLRAGVIIGAGSCFFEKPHCDNRLALAVARRSCSLYPNEPGIQRIGLIADYHACWPPERFTEVRARRRAVTGSFDGHPEVISCSRKLPERGRESTARTRTIRLIQARRSPFDLNGVVAARTTAYRSDDSTPIVSSYCWWRWPTIPSTDTSAARVTYRRRINPPPTKY